MQNLPEEIGISSSCSFSIINGFRVYQVLNRPRRECKKQPVKLVGKRNNNQFIGQYTHTIRTHVCERSAFKSLIISAVTASHFIQAQFNKFEMHADRKFN